jgi:hypothetical protein
LKRDPSFLCGTLTREGTKPGDNMGFYKVSSHTVPGGAVPYQNSKEGSTTKIISNEISLLDLSIPHIGFKTPYQSLCQIGKLYRGTEPMNKCGIAI